LQAGYRVVATASERNKDYVLSLGATEVFDYHSPSIYSDLLASGPYNAIYAASDSAADQLVIGKLLASQGGGKFLATMGVRPTVVLPTGVEGFFVQYLDDYLKPENADFTRWLFWEFLEEGLVKGRLKLGRVEVIGGLGKLQEGLDRLREGTVSGRKLVIRPYLD
jgi:hypothetical protein